jgi:hypothetical protein
MKSILKALKYQGLYQGLTDEDANVTNNFRLTFLI